LREDSHKGGFDGLSIAIKKHSVQFLHSGDQAQNVATLEILNWLNVIRLTMKYGSLSEDIQGGHDH